MKNQPRFLFRSVWLAAVLLLAGGVGLDAAALAVFAVGNSFSENATKYLPELVQAGGHELVIGRAQAGGCSLEQHWEALAADLANPGDPKGKIYGGKSLRERLAGRAWDVITIQQYSWLSSDAATYAPFARQLVAELRKLQPNARIVVHQTWAYRVDADKFGESGAASQQEMWEKSRAAYWKLAADVGADGIIPTGDAFHQIDANPVWGFRPDLAFDAKAARPPTLPAQEHSLHAGYAWKAGKLAFDSHHANAAGQYLGALVWYGFLFHESPLPLDFVPAGVPPDFAFRLRETAWAAVCAAEAQHSGLPPHLHLAGDSTMADKPVDPPNPERGWGQLLPLYFRDPTMIVNHAVNGRSTKSFSDLGHWARLRAALQPGDWVIIQFGHNDQKKSDPVRYADAHTDYPANLRRFIADVRAAGAFPVLATPVMRQNFAPDGKLVPTHEDYPAAMRRVAVEANVPLLDMQVLTETLVNAYGPERSNQLYLHIAPGEYETLPKGRNDTTHLSALGAARFAELATAEIRRQQLPLARWFK